MGRRPAVSFPRVAGGGLAGTGAPGGGCCGCLAEPPFHTWGWRVESEALAARDRGGEWIGGPPSGNLPGAPEALTDLAGSSGFPTGDPTVAAVCPVPTLGPGHQKTRAGSWSCPGPTAECCMTRCGLAAGPPRQKPGRRAQSLRRGPSARARPWFCLSEAVRETWDLQAGYGGTGWGRTGRSATPMWVLLGSAGEGASGPQWPCVQVR